MDELKTDVTERPEQRAALALVAHGLAVLIGCTGVYYVVPLEAWTAEGAVFLAIRFAAAVLGASALIVWQVLVYRRAWASGGAARLQGLAVALYAAILSFAAFYYILATSTAGSFEGIRTRTDALYFALTVVTTVGFGDVHAAGQGARAIVSVQMVFDVVVIGAAIATARSLPPAAPRPAAKRGPSRKGS